MENKNQSVSGDQEEDSTASGLVKWLYPADLILKQLTQSEEKMSSTENNCEPTIGQDDKIENSNERVETTTLSESESQQNNSVENKSKTMEEDISQKVSVGANYIGSVFSSAWSKTAKTAESAFTKVVEVASPTTETGPEEESKEKEETKKDVPENKAMVSSFFSNALTSLGTLTNKENKDNNESEQKEKPEEGGDDNKEKKDDLISGFSNAFTKVTKVANDASTVLKENINIKTPAMLSEFNKEQESFIKNKDQHHNELGVAPWIGYHGEEELKSKILSLSEDKRNFVRAPPSGVSFEFEYASVSAVAVALLQEDSRLQKMRYELVPKKVKEEDFWRNYFYRVSLIKQSFELKDLELNEKVEKEKKESKMKEKSENRLQPDTEPESEPVVEDEEFVSDSYQASKSDLAEVDESMKKLGVGGSEADQWEAELEGELNEFEVVNNSQGEDNPEWENQIQEMLDEAESQK